MSSSFYLSLLMGSFTASAVPPSVINALIDALSPLGVTAIDMPATPSRVWEAIEGARAAKH